MAKKQDELKYLQVPLPSGGKTYKMIKVEWSGLNRSRELDTGMLTDEMDISTKYAPYLTPSEVPEQYFKTSGAIPISMFGFDDFLCLIYIKNSKVWVDYIRDGEPFTGLVSDTLDFGDEVLRSMVQFNVYDTVTDPVSGNYRRRLLIFPDRAAMPMYIYDAELNLTSAKDEDGNTFYYAEHDDAKAAVERLEYGVMIHCGGKWYEYLDIVTDKTNYGKCKFKLNSSEAYFKCDGMNATYRTYNKKPDDDIIKGVENLTDEEKNAKLEEYALSSAPDKTANTNYYYYNAATREMWRYVEVETEGGGSKWDWRVSTAPSVPALKYATVHLSRVFGVDDVRVYASGFNDYCNWTLDTISSYNEANAWVSASQASSKADGIFTGIVTYEGHVVCFKRDYMQEIYNTKNPFRINEIFAEGAIDFRTIQEVDGKLFFVSGDNVKLYTGSNPRVVGSELNINEYKYAASGSDDRYYYLYCEDEDENRYIFTYDTHCGCWSRQAVYKRVISFAHNKSGMYRLESDGAIYRLDTGAYSDNWSFDTDITTRQSSSEISANIKHIKKLQMMADVSRNAEFSVYLLYDDEEFDANTSQLVYSSDGRHGRLTVRVLPRMTAHYGFRLHICGSGFVKLYGMEIWLESGGGLYV